MSTTTLSTDADEESTYAITIGFTDEAGSAVTPNTATWTLTDAAGEVINSREDVSIGSLSSSVTVVLSGDDLTVTAGGDSRQLRFFTVEGDYDSSLGSGLPFKQEVRFYVRNLVAVT